jgi:hypothetical protein
MEHFLIELRMWFLTATCFACPLTREKFFVDLRIWLLIVMCFSCPQTHGKFPYKTNYVYVVSNSDVFCLSSDTCEILCRTKNIVPNSGVFFLSPDTWKIS